MKEKLQCCPDRTSYSVLMIDFIVVVVISCNSALLSSGFTLKPREVILSAAYCLSTEERESAISSLRDSFSNHLTQLEIVPQCGDGLWYRVAYINMNDSTQECPSNSAPKPGLVDDQAVLDQAALVCTFLHCHHNTCGRAIGYQDGSTDGFHIFGQPQPNSADDHYADGLSVTLGRMPRTHIWTYAAGASVTVMIT